MSSIGERIKLVRKNHKLTQTEFGERIHVKGNTITGYETGPRNPPDATIANICREFNVREEWLRSGVGPMEPERSRQEEIMFLFGQVMQQDNPDHLAILERVLRLSPESIQFYKDAILAQAAIFHAAQSEKEPES